MSKLNLKSINLRYIKQTVIKSEMVCNRNCENFIGSTQVPLGVAGPIKISINNQQSIINNLFLPLATTEGALVASVNRGCKATRLSGGIKTFVEDIGASRAPLFRVKNLEEGRQLIKFVKLDKLNKLIRKEEAFIKLLKIEPYQLGRNVWLRCFFETSEAMGMNMATIACQKIADYIKEKLNIDCLALSGNMCVDKKPAWLNFASGRGKKVWAEAVIKKEIVQKILKTSPEKIIEVVQKKMPFGGSYVRLNGI
jgi:hydroxymethylglutaryl-CoA reductase (NADPH)